MRDIPVGNGKLLINFDDKYQIRDVYFPHVGQENHSEGFPFRFGIWVDGHFSWVFEDQWSRVLKYRPNSLVTDVRLVNDDLQIEIICNDMVACQENIFLRRIEVRELSGNARSIRVFLHHDFRIYENKVGDTAFFDPVSESLIHYKKHRYFLINTKPHFNQYATGRKAFRQQEGTWRDAEDGELAGGSITEGSVDSTIAVHLEIGAGQAAEFHYWIAAGVDLAEVLRLSSHIDDGDPQEYFDDCSRYWEHWLPADRSIPDGISPEIAEQYKRSLLIARTQIDQGGAIIAANDHDVTERATDHYSYLWPRDGAFVANAFDIAGFPDVSRRFLKMAAEIVSPGGYFLQKYNPDGTVGSGWHSWLDTYKGRRLLPIQQDETALVLWALGEHYKLYVDEQFLESLQYKLITKCGDFLETFRDADTGLPLPSWNLWEDRRGIHTFTCASVVGGLRAAAGLCAHLGDIDRAERYDLAADQITTAMRLHLYDEEKGRFLRGLLAHGDDELTPDATVDASLFGIFYFDCFDIADPMVTTTMDAVEDKLLNKTTIGGVARFENDGYMRETDGHPGNSWFICTLWLAEYYTARAATKEDLDIALFYIEWASANALPSGVMSEQIDPISGKHLSVSPLTWSHSSFAAAVARYSERLKEL